MSDITRDLIDSDSFVADEPAADVGIVPGPGVIVDAKVISAANPVRVLPSMNTTAVAPSPVVFDRAGFCERMMYDEELMHEVEREFLLDTSTQIADLRMHCENGDAQQAGSVAHRIKGAAANVGAEAMRETAAAIELAGKNGDLAPIKAAIDKLELQFVLLGNAWHEAVSHES